MLWWTLAIALLLVALIFFLQRHWRRPWHELEHLLTRIGRGEQPPTFLLSGTAEARRVGLALERILIRQRELDRQITTDAAEMRAVFAALADGLLVIDPSGRIRFCNRAFEKQYAPSGITPGTPLLEAIRDSDASVFARRSPKAAHRSRNCSRPIVKINFSLPCFQSLTTTRR
jgi:PAS domain-containing protein